MKKIFVFSLFIILLTALQTKAQPNIEKIQGLISFDDQLVRAALDSVLVIIRQDYFLRYKSGNSNKDFGRGGNVYFGRAYGIGVLSDNKIWTDGRLKTPWLTDENYREYQSADTLKPVLTHTYIRKINEQNFRKMRLSLKDSTKSDIFYFETTDKTKSIDNIENSKDTNGWLIMAYTKDDIQNDDSCDIYLYTFRPRPQFKNNNYCQVKMPQKENILGGGYFTSITTLGNIKFHFTGILFKKAQNWLLSVIPIENKNEELNEIKRTKSDTGVDKKNKKSK